MAKNAILVLGAGELGTAVIESLVSNPRYSSTNTPVTLLVRRKTLESPSPSKTLELEHFRSLGVSVLAGDTESDSPSTLTELLRPFHTVVHAAGMTAQSGTATRLTDAVLAAGVKLYLPWQFGVDYDVIGADGGYGLFAEQHAIRQTLRAQSTTQWLVVSCGIFMSFLFEEAWGVVRKLDGGRLHVTALNSWEDWITATAAEDIGRCTAELVLSEEEEKSRVVYIAGDSLTYGEFADVVERETGKETVREVWPVEHLREEARKEPDVKLRKYHVVFAGGEGLSWPKERTWNWERGVEMEDVAHWLRRNWK